MLLIRFMTCVLFMIFLMGCASVPRIKNITALPPIVPKKDQTKPVMLKKVVLTIQRGKVIGAIEAGLLCVPQGQLY